MYSCTCRTRSCTRLHYRALMPVWKYRILAVAFDLPLCSKEGERLSHEERQLQRRSASLNATFGLMGELAGSVTNSSDICTMLYYTKVYYTILYYTILYYTILYYTILYYTILYYTILYYTILYYTILYYTILYYARLNYGLV